MTPEPVIPISAIEHFLYCPRQCALIHCDGVWSDNAHTARGTRAHRRVDGGQHRMERGRRVLRGIPLWSESLGLSGRADVVEMDGDAIRPVEYKSGVRHGITADLQLCAQALCLEEMLGVAVPSGSVWYGGPRRRVEVDFTDVLRVLVAIVPFVSGATGSTSPMCCGIRCSSLSMPFVSSCRRGSCPTPRTTSGATRNQVLLHHCLPGVTTAPRTVRRYMSTVVFGCAI